MTKELHDIESRADVELLVDAFYKDAMADPLIGFLFTDVAHLDMEKHRPVITSFWETLLLNAGSYGGGAFAVHARLNEKVPLQPGHFARWVSLWSQTVQSLFQGPVATAAMVHGARIASAFLRRLNDPDAGIEESDLLQITHVPGAELR
jgi:hemoglobin